MIPVRLSLRNFLSYRDGAPTLDLDGVHVACLCGDNGHGKSALLDAVTWALWGRSRVNAQHEPLIHQGESETRVELDFQAGDGLYRVSRRYARASRSRQGATVLELQLLGGEEPQSLTGNTVRDTERRIESLLRMNYDTFVNSAFIKQGEADLFTASTPGDRKEVLGAVLDLSWYEQLAQRARREARERESESLRLDGEIDYIDREVSQKDEYERRLSDVEAQLEVVAAEEGEREAQLATQQERVRNLQDARGQLERLEEEAARLRDETAAREQREQDGRRQLEEARAKAAGLPKLESEEAQAAAQVKQLSQPSAAMAGHEARVRELQAAERGFREAGASLLESVMEMESAQRELALRESEASRISEDIDRRERQAEGEKLRLEQLRARAAGLPELESETAEARDCVERLSSPSPEMDGMAGQSQELQARVAQLKVENASLRQEMEDLKAKKDMLDAATGPDGAGATCPLCGTALAEEGCLHLAENYESQGKALAGRFRENEAEAHSAEQRRAEIQRELESMDGRRRAELRAAQDRLGSLTHGVADAKAAADEADRLAAAREAEDAALESSRSRLEETQAAMPPLRARLAALDDARAQHEQNETAMRDAESEREQLESDLEAMAAERRDELARAQARRDDVTRRLAEASAAAGTIDRLAESVEHEAALLADARSRLQTTLDAMPTLREASDALPTAVEEYEAARAGLAATRGRREGLLAQRTEAQAWLNRCREMEQRRVSLLAERSEAADRQGAYEQLAVAFGRSGIQALLIEQAIPELQAYANEALGRVTEHRMSLTLETQRQSRSGGDPRETLDIRIADELGTRSYETYSGGEAFRIDFALRIGLSRLLAHRSGAPLPTLFIDEGFGSQDAAGLDRLVEAIQAIQNDFKRILVITHIEELKDRFPVRIEVTKTAGGSTFELS